MAFNDYHGGATFPHFIEFHGTKHKLLITTRTIHPAMNDVALNEVIKATVKTWLHVATCYNRIQWSYENEQEYELKFEDSTALEKCGYQQSLEPHVTVVNHSFDMPTFTVVSNEKPSQVIRQIEAQFASVYEMKEVMPQLFLDSGVKTPPQTQQNQPKQGKIGDSSNPIGANTESVQNTLKPWIRETKPFTDGILKIQTGKDNNFDKVAKIETSYDYKNPPNEDGLYAYVLNNVAWSVGAYTKDNVTSLYVDMPLAGSNIRIFDKGDGNPHNYEWQSLAKHLGHSESQGLRDMAGQSFFVPQASYVVMKKAGNYVNYFGLYS